MKTETDQRTESVALLEGYDDSIDTQEHSSWSQSKLRNI